MGSLMGSPAPMAAAMGSSMSRAQRAPALSAASRTARRSTSVTPEGMPSSMRGRGTRPTRSCTRCTKYLIICSVTSKSLMTPSRSGRTGVMLAGVRPSIRLAAAPISMTLRVFVSTATMLGSLMTMPRPRTWTSVLAVPRSIPMSRENAPKNASIIVRRASSLGGQAAATSDAAPAARRRPQARTARCPGAGHGDPARPPSTTADRCAAQYTRGLPSSRPSSGPAAQARLRSARRRRPGRAG